MIEVGLLWHTQVAKLHDRILRHHPSRREKAVMTKIILHHQSENKIPHLQKLMLCHLIDDNHPDGLGAVASLKMEVILHEVQCTGWILVPVLVHHHHVMAEVQPHVTVVHQLPQNVNLLVHAVCRSATTVLSSGIVTTVQLSIHEVQKLESVIEARYTAVITVRLCTGDLQVTTVALLVGVRLQNHLLGEQCIHLHPLRPQSRGHRLRGGMSRTENSRQYRGV